MDTVARKRLRLLDSSLPCGCGSRKAAGPESWFTETIHLALDPLQGGGDHGRAPCLTAMPGKGTGTLQYIWLSAYFNP